MKTKLLSVDYLGYTAMDRRFSSAMLPWVLLEIRRRGTREKLCLGVECGNLQAYDVNFELQFSHKLQNIMRFTQVQSNPTEFLYLVKDGKEHLLYCYLFQACTVEEVSELFGHMKELAPHGGSMQSLNKNTDSGKRLSPASSTPTVTIQRQTSVSTNRGFQLNMTESPTASVDGLNKTGTNMSQSRSYSTGLNRSGSTLASDNATSSFPLVRSASNAANLTSLCVDISPSNSHFFEVLYIGKIKVSHKKVPETLIDDALGKFKQYEIEKAKAAQMRRNSLLSAQADSLYSEDDIPEKIIHHNAKRVEFAPLPLSHKKDLKLSREDSNGGKQDGLMSPSLTPLDGSKHFFSDDEDDIVNEKKETVTKKSFPVALEPTVLIINHVQNDNHNNLSTLTEDDSEFSPSHHAKNQELDSEKLNNIIKSKYQNRTKTFSESQESLDSNPYEDNFKKPFSRDRSASIGTLNLNKTPITQLIGDQNRTMLFQVGRTDLRLISPDRKQILLHKQLRDVASCVQGMSNREHFGFICREPDMECFVGYVFKCQSDSVSCDVVGAITQAFVAHSEMAKQGKEKSPMFTCEHCPMVWYHKLCQELDGLNEKRIHSTILRRIDQLVEEEQVQIITKYQGGTEDLLEVGERNAFLMMLLRAHCEAKQQRHVHDTAENRSEFLNQYLGGSTIFMKAKRSLSSSFDHLLKRKASKDDISVSIKDFKKESSPMSHLGTPTRETADFPLDDTKLNGRFKDNSSSPKDISLNLQQNGRDMELSPSPQLKSPMMDIFMKLGNNPSAKGYSKNEHKIRKRNDDSESDESSSDHLNNMGSWRQAIFKRVMQTGTLVEEFENSRESGVDSPVATTGELLRRPSSYSNFDQMQPKKRNKEEIKELWKKGINQAILLIRMEKENARLRAKQEVSAVKRIKLEYEDIGSGGNENSKVWDILTAPRESRISTKVDSQMLLQSIRNGVPRAKRGEVWYFLAEQFCLRQPPPDIKHIPNYSVPYESLLKQLTSHQHAILIDLGRTFPNHTYFSSPLGPGQLALFNLLKAYSLLDPEVGYCQGLSFVAGVLLLHLEEAEAFLMLRHLMFRRGLRKQYLPDMIALQIQLYQLSRLLKDHIPELYEKFDEYDVSPTLYAAPWILTIFTSQFPLGFVTRVFDLLFLESSEIIFRVAIALLDIHKDNIMICDSFEEIMDYMKHKMPNIDKPMLDKVIKRTFALDFGRQLNEYLVEYHVLQEEMAAIAPKMEALGKLESENKQLERKNRQLLEQLDISSSKTNNLQASQNRLENQVKSLEQTVANLARFIGTTHDKKKDSELPSDIRKLCQQVQQGDRKTFGVLGQKFGQSFTSKFSSTDFSNDNSNSLSEESSSDLDDKAVEKTSKYPHILKTGLSAPNLFNKEPVKQQPKVVEAPVNQQDLEKKRQYLSMKKSYSCNAGLMANTNDLNKKAESNVVTPSIKISPTLKGYPLRVLDESSEYVDTAKSEISTPMESKKTSKFFAHSHEQIRQQKLQAEQLKRDFDDNLRKLDARLSPHGSTHDLTKPNYTSPASMPHDIQLSLNNQSLSGDSGLGTPISPPSDKLPSQTSFLSVDSKNNEEVIANHPLVGCDVDIKFDVHSTKLKSLRPLRTASSLGTKQ